MNIVKIKQKRNKNCLVKHFLFYALVSFSFLTGHSSTTDPLIKTVTPKKYFVAKTQLQQENLKADPLTESMQKSV